jgi:PAS domain S-box-containing protein
MPSVRPKHYDLMRATFERAPIGIAHCTPDGRILEANPRLCAILRFPGDELASLRLPAIAAPGDRALVEDLLRTLGDAEDSRSAKIQYVRRDGAAVRASLALTLVRDPNGMPQYAIAMLEDVAAQPLSLERTESLNAEVERRVNERTAELRVAVQELEVFACSVSHDLRSPVRAIEGFTDMLIEEHGIELSGSAGNLLLRVRGAAMRMSTLIDGLLALSRTSRAALRDERVDLSGLAREIASELRAQSPDRRVEFEIHDGLETRGDSALLRQVLENVLGNAWKYTSCKSAARIEFGAGEGDAGTEYYVRDDGVGFDMSAATRLFRPFERLHSEAEFPGIGVGLATVHRIVRRHGGSIRGEARPGAGATFYFTLGRAA